MSATKRAGVWPRPSLPPWRQPQPIRLAAAQCEPPRPQLPWPGVPPQGVRRPGACRLGAALAAVLVAATLAACDGRSAAPAAAPPPAEVSAQSTGHFCGMRLADHDGPKGQIHLASRKDPVWFSSVRDTVSFLRLPEEARDIAAVYVSDMARARSWERPEPGAWVEARAAWFVIDSRLRGGMGAPEAVPFSDEAAAQAFRERHGGQVVRLDGIPDAYVLGPVDLAAQPAEAQPATGHSAPGHSASNHPSPDRPALSHPAPDHSALNHPAAGHPAPDHSALNHPAAGHPAAGHSALSHPAAPSTKADAAGAAGHSRH